MSLFTINGTTVPIDNTSGAVKKAPEQGGSDSRAYAGNLRSTRRWQKRVWQITTMPIEDALATTIEGLIALGAVVTCGGTALTGSGGGTILCICAYTDSPAYLNQDTGDGLGFQRQLTITVREV